MVQINLSLVVAAIVTIAPALAHPLSRREDANIVGSADLSRRSYGENSVLFGRDIDFDLEQREPSWDAFLHPIRTWREHRQVKTITAAAKAEAEAHIKQEHADADVQTREPSWDAFLHPIRTWREHRRVKAITAAAKAEAEAQIKQEHADADVQTREPSWNAVFHPMRTWKEHRRVKAITAAAKAAAEANIKQAHADALGGAGGPGAGGPSGPTTRREYIDELLAERFFDDFDLEARDFEDEY